VFVWQSPAQKTCNGEVDLPSCLIYIIHHQAILIIFTSPVGVIIFAKDCSRRRAR